MYWSWADGLRVESMPNSPLLPRQDTTQQSTTAIFRCRFSDITEGTAGRCSMTPSKTSNLAGAAKGLSSASDFGRPRDLLLRDTSLSLVSARFSASELLTELIWHLHPAASLHSGWFYCQHDRYVIGTKTRFIRRCVSASSL